MVLRRSQKNMAIPPQRLDMCWPFGDVWGAVFKQLSHPCTYNREGRGPLKEIGNIVIGLRWSRKRIIATLSKRLYMAGLIRYVQGLLCELFGGIWRTTKKRRRHLREDGMVRARVRKSNENRWQYCLREWIRVKFARSMSTHENYSRRMKKSHVICFGMAGACETDYYIFAEIVNPAKNCKNQWFPNKSIELWRTIEFWNMWLKQIECCEIAIIGRRHLGLWNLSNPSIQMNRRRHSPDFHGNWNDIHK